LIAVGQTAEDFEDHAKIALGTKVRDLDAAEVGRVSLEFGDDHVRLLLGN
jgi:hypothetical protein